MNYQVYVSKSVPLPDGYIPTSLIEVESKYKSGIKVDKKAYDNWLDLKTDAFKQNIIIDIESAYRSFDYQKKVLDDLIALKGEEYASNAVAKPGHSEHQTGLAIDYCILKDGVFLNSDDDVDLLYSLDECKYIASIAHKYGFIIRYSEGKEHITGYKYEPWHLRYVGKHLATYLYENDITLDEYYIKNSI
jgi:D-alanyl-D-alanine carboxypeptidase